MIADLIPSTSTDSKPQIARCRVCGCTDDDCRFCILLTGQPCSWAEPGLCSACVADPTPAGRRQRIMRCLMIARLFLRRAQSIPTAAEEDLRRSLFLTEAGLRGSCDLVEHKKLRRRRINIKPERKKRNGVRPKSAQRRS
jgi:hypothetical protein